MRDSLRRASLRRQVALMEEIRDRLMSEPGDDYDRWSEALMPLTDKLLHELMEMEGAPPYSHPLDRQWWSDEVPA